MPKSLKNSLTLLLVVLFLAGCGEKPLFDEIKPIAKSGWHQDSILTFVVDVKSTELQYLPSIKVRHNANYNYANLYLFRTITTDEGLEFSDTVDLTLANDVGKWLGSGIGEVKVMEWGYGRGGLRFTKDEEYTFTLQHGMRDTVLVGIMDVGLKVVEIKQD